MVKIIYILSLPHAGFTLLEMMLSNFSDVVGVGEVKYLLKAKNKNELESLYSKETCSCGKLMEECEYWSDFKKVLLRAINSSFEEKYKLHFNYFKEFYGEHAIMIDNSKDLETFQKLVRIQAISFIPIFLIKDVRSQVYSVKRKSQKLGLKRKIETLRAFYGGIEEIKNIENFAKLKYPFLESII